MDLKACITRIEENGYGANLAPWPARLLTPPDRLQTIQIDSYIARKELFVAESKYWKEIISNYVNALHWKQIGLRNVLDMRAGFGGYFFLSYRSLIRNFIYSGVSNFFFFLFFLADLQLH